MYFRFETSLLFFPFSLVSLWECSLLLALGPLINRVLHPLQVSRCSSLKRALAGEKNEDNLGWGCLLAPGRRGPLSSSGVRGCKLRFWESLISLFFLPLTDGTWYPAMLPWSSWSYPSFFLNSSPEVWASSYSGTVYSFLVVFLPSKSALP